MLHFSVPLSITSLIRAYHSLHMPFQTILAFCVILQQYTTLFYRNISSLIQTCTHFSGLALLLFTNAVKKEKRACTRTIHSSGIQCGLLQPVLQIVCQNLY